MYLSESPSTLCCSAQMADKIRDVQIDALEPIQDQSDLHFGYDTSRKSFLRSTLQSFKRLDIAS